MACLGLMARHVDRVMIGHAGASDTRGALSYRFLNYFVILIYFTTSLA